MNTNHSRAIALVGLGCILPDAPNPAAFWNNLVAKCYSITEVPPERWSAKDYYDPDPLAPDKTYSKIGGWVRGFEFDWKQYRLPPRVANAMDQGQQWAVTIAAQALADYGYPGRPLDLERTGVIMGTAMGGEMHYLTALRVSFPEYANALQSVTEFSQLPCEVRAAILGNWHKVIDGRLPSITEDSMPGELANIVSGRVANLLNLRGPNFITDAACAASIAAIDAAVELLSEHHCDAIISGGVDHNMGAASFVKFCKIGALSATGSRPFGDGADGFVMGEGSAAFLLKRLEDAERDGDRIYAVIRGVGGSSDGKGKGITAPNPLGQVLAIQRAWENAGLDPATATLVEAHGTSTKVGDVVEVESLSKVFGGARRNSIALGSVKSNIGHLKGGAGAAGLLKSALALYHKVLPPTLNSEKPNPNINFTATPFYLNHEAREWSNSASPRRLGVSAYGFGGTNFHCVLEEHVPGMLKVGKVYAGVSLEKETSKPADIVTTPSKIPVRGILAIGATTAVELKERTDAMLQRAEAGWIPPVEAPRPSALSAPERLVIDFGTQEELIERLAKAQRALGFDNPQAWKAVQAQGIFRGSGARPGKIAFLFPGQGSQYLNMGRELAAQEPIVAQTFKDGDEVMTPILGKPLSSYFFVDSADPKILKQGEFDLMQTAITQPAMLTMDTAFFKLLGEFDFKPDMVMGHSLGEYAALIAAGVMPFADALEATAARGAEMTKFSIDDNGWMAAVIAPLDVVEQTLGEIDGYVVAANINSNTQAVIGGASKAVEQAIELFNQKGCEARRIPVSHAFHTKIVAPAGVPLREVLNRLRVSSPQIPIVANVTGEIYPTDPDDIREMLQRQVASPVQWVKGLNTLYANGVRTFVEVGPKKALKGFADDVLGSKPDVVSLFTNHPKMGELPTFNQAVCGLYAAGYALTEERPIEVIREPESRIGKRAEGSAQQDVNITEHVSHGAQQASVVVEEAIPAQASFASDKLITHLVAQAVQQIVHQMQTSQPKAFDRNETPLGSVVISGTGLGLPGAEKAVMDPDNALRILRGEQFVDLVPERFRKLMLRKQITRLVKSEDGSGHFEIITDPDEVIKLAGRPGRFDLHEEYGVPEKLVEALDITTQLAMAAGLDALREAGIPLVQTYKRTTTGKFLPDRWLLPEALRDETGVIFASAFPGGDRFADELTRYYVYEGRMATLQELEDLRRYTSDPQTLAELNRRILDLREALSREPYVFDRHFLFRVLSMGHSQFAEYIGARGPNTQVNAACASTPQAIALAEDWIRSGRCRRVIVIGADNVTSDVLMEWISAGFLASGAAATDDRVEEAALPFDRRRHGTIIGMGACALVVESEDTVRERGMRGMVELLSSETNNSAYHGTRLDVEHIASIMNNLMTSAERRFGLNRFAIAPQTVFMSHETFTPARGGSAAAEVVALRQTFGSATDDIVVANTKGFTGHPMGVGIEDVIVAKILEYGIVPPVPNYREVDPDLGTLNLSRGGRYNVQYAVHLAAGFGSQVAMTLTRRIPGGLDRMDNPSQYQRWLANVSGYDRVETEVVKRVLRVIDQGEPVRQPAPSTWQAGTGPTVRATAPGDGSIAAPRPAPLIAPVQSQPRLDIAPLPEPVKLEPYNREPLNKTMDNKLQTTVEEVKPVVQEPAVNSPSVTIDIVKDRILAIVAEKTGYPPDMLALDLDLEADLGVDTVKQAETFAAIRGEFDIPRREDLKLRDYPTLNHVIAFVYEMRPDLKADLMTKGQGDKRTGGQEVKGLSISEEHLVIPSSSPRVTEASATDVVRDRILAIVAEKTGYPPDMLDLDLDLEADLGVDTVKQAETFAAIRNEFNIPRRDDLKLRDYPTLNHVIGFVYEMRPDLKNDTVKRRQGDTVKVDHFVTPSPSHLVMPYALEDADRIPRRVPVPVLRPALGLCKSTGIALDALNRVLVMQDNGGVGRSLVEQLQQRGVTVLTIAEPLSPAVLEEQIKTWLAAGPIDGVYWLPALDEEPALDQLTLADWRELSRVRVKNLYTTMRILCEAINKAGTFLIAATRLGGLHGYDEAGATAPLGGAVVGFTKAYKRERGDVLVKAIDFAVDGANLADELINETLRDPGAVEVGYHHQLRFAIGLEERSAVNGLPGLTLDKNTVFVVTGAAGGITSEIITDLATASSGVFYLLDLVPAPEWNSANIKLFRSDKEALRQKLIDEMKAAGEKPTPVKVEKQLFAIERSEAALRAVEAVDAAGGVTFYHSVNLLDEAAVADIVNDIRQRYGRIDVLLHAGGVEISRLLADKEPKEFDLVFDVKAEGFFNILHAAKDLPIGAIVSFSSVAGRFGNAGQTDYSAANDLLCKLTSNLRRTRPTTRAIVIDWTAWGGIGMATRGSIPKIMEAAGIDTLPPKAGVPTIRRELTRGGTRGEIVVAGRLGLMLNEFDETGGLDVGKVNRMIARSDPPFGMIGVVKAAKVYSGLEIETTLDPHAQPFLFDHQMEGLPLLPGVMGTEAFAQAASLVAPGYTVVALEREQFESPFKFYRMQPRTLYLSAVVTPDGNDLIAHTTLRSIMPAPRSDLPPQEKIHFTADVRLSPNPIEPRAIEFTPPSVDDLGIGCEQIYRIFFHGPAYRVIDRARVKDNGAIGLLPAELPPNASPANAVSIMSPRLIEACFQLAGVWKIATQQQMALPLSIGSVTSYRQWEEAQGRLYAAVTTPDGEAFDAHVIDEAGNVYVELKGYRTVALPGEVNF